MNFVDGESNDVVNVYVDGALVHTGKSWEDYYRHDDEQAPANEVPTTDQLLFREAGLANPATAGKGIRIDDLRIESSDGSTATGTGGLQGPAGPRGPQGPGTQTGGGTNTVLGVQGQSPKLRLAVRKKRLSHGKIAVRVRCKAERHVRGQAASHRPRPGPHTAGGTQVLLGQGRQGQDPEGQAHPGRPKDPW